MLPALNAGTHVVSDRSAYSSLAYQGYGRLLDIDELKRFNNWAIAGNWPDLVVFIDVPLDTLLERLKNANWIASSAKTAHSSNAFMQASPPWPRPTRSVGLLSTAPHQKTNLLPQSQRQ